MVLNRRHLYVVGLQVLCNGDTGGRDCVADSRLLDWCTHPALVLPAFLQHSGITGIERISGIRFARWARCGARLEH